MHEYTVELRISAEHLDVSRITEDLGLTPTQVRRKGQRRSVDKVWSEDLWAFEVFPDAKKSWASLNDGLNSLLGVVLPKRRILSSFGSDVDVYLWCGHFSSEFGGGPTLAVETLRSLAELGVEMRLESYVDTGRTLA